MASSFTSVNPHEGDASRKEHAELPVAADLTFFDQIVAMQRALSICRRRQNLPDHADVSVKDLCEARNDYKRYHNSTIRSWKRMAHSLSPEALEFPLQKKPDLKIVFSKKTIQESSMLTTLKNFPGAQLWYLKRLVYLKAQDKIRRFKATYFKKMAKMLERLASAMLDFAACLEHIFDLEQGANTFRDLVKKGQLSFSVSQPKVTEQFLMSFSQNYLCSPMKDEEMQPVLQERESDTLLFPHIFYQIVAAIHFENDHEKACGMFEAPPHRLRPRFTSHSQIFQKRSQSATEFKTPLQIMKKRYLLRSSTKSGRKPRRASPPQNYSEQEED